MFLGKVNFEAPGGSPSPRICMPTWRSFKTNAYRCGQYEAQDVLTATADVDLINIEESWAARLDESWLRTPLYHDASGCLIHANPGLRKVQLRKDYDVFIAICTTFWDLPYINAITRWKDHCKVSVCWLEELWVSEIPNYKRWLPALSRFDYVFVGLKETAAALSRIINRPCHWLPGGVDVLRFGSFPDRTSRCVDVYSIGRRYEGIHRELLKSAETGEIFYLHDSQVGGGLTAVYDHKQHRNLLANTAKRSRYYMVAGAKMDQADFRRGQVEVGYRYYEGAAAGAVLVGDVLDCDPFRELMGWPEAVVPIRPDGSDTLAVLKELNSDPERFDAISRRNAKEAARRHDWVHRWNKMFRTIGVAPAPDMIAREQRLRPPIDISAGADQRLSGS